MVPCKECRCATCTIRMSIPLVAAVPKEATSAVMRTAQCTDRVGNATYLMETLPIVKNNKRRKKVKEKSCRILLHWVTAGISLAKEDQGTMLPTYYLRCIPIPSLSSRVTLLYHSTKRCIRMYETRLWNGRFDGSISGLARHAKLGTLVGSGIRSAQSTNAVSSIGATKSRRTRRYEWVGETTRQYLSPR